MTELTRQTSPARHAGADGSRWRERDPGGSAQPPAAPEVPPRVRMHRGELVGMIVIALVPLLAIFGLFGPGTDQVRAGGDAIALEVRYPARYRLGMVQTMQARVSNRSASPMARVTLAVDSAYLKGFTTASPVPDFSRAYAVEMVDLAPGETRMVVLDLVAERPGRFRGQASAVHAGDSVAVRLTTLVLP